MNHKILWTIIAVLVVIVIVLLVVAFMPHGVPGGTAGSAPAGATSPDGGLIVTSPAPNGPIGDPASIEGTASGLWAQNGFSVQVFNGSGLMVGDAGSMIQGGTTTGPSAFTANIPYAPSVVHSGESGKVVFTANRNASGTATSSVASFSFPVTFQ